MDEQQLAPVAKHLLAAYSDTADYSRRFKDQHDDMPPSVMAKAHHMRSVAQALIGNDDWYRLSSQYAEFGRVLFTDVETGIKLLLRSSAALRMENLQTVGQMDLGISVVPVFVKSPVRLVVYEFGKEGVDLSVVGTKQQATRKRLMAAGAPIHVGSWSYTSIVESEEKFDQAARDDFKEVGALGYDDEAGSTE